MFIADSKGRNLDLDLRELLNTSFTLAFFPGAKILDTITREESLITSSCWAQIYCLAGICDLTTKDRLTRAVSIRNCYIPKLIDQYCYSLHLTAERITSLSQPGAIPRCVFSPVTGMNLLIYNKRINHPDDATDQDLLNEAVTLVNSEVTKFNTSLQVSTPWTSRIIHRRHRNTFINYYDKLSSDGCHLSQALRLHWAHGPPRSGN